MERQNIYPSREKEFDRELKRLEVADILKENKDLILKYLVYMQSKSKSDKQRWSKLIGELRRICLTTGCLLAQLDKDKAMEIISKYNGRSDLSPATTADYRSCIKHFYTKWYKKNDPRFDSPNLFEQKKAKDLYEYLDEVSTTYKHKEVDAKTIISDEECALVVEKGCRTYKEKAFIDCLHKSGCRAGEFLNIRLMDIIIEDDFIKINVDGKTGARPIFLTNTAMANLIKYLDVHPKKDDKTSFLWLNEANNVKNTPMRHRGATKMVAMCFERAGMEKRHNMHWFRHSRASILCPKMTTPMLCKFMGWGLDSKQVKTYSHLSAKDLEDVFLQINGIKTKDDKTEQLIKCACGSLNSQKERYCYKCSKPLRVETIIQDQELANSEINKTMQFFMEMAKNPEMMKRFEEFQKRSGG